MIQAKYLYGAEIDMSGKNNNHLMNWYVAFRCVLYSADDREFFHVDKMNKEDLF